MSAKKIGKVQSKRNLTTKEINKKLPYIELLLMVGILLLFTTAHYLHTIYYLSESTPVIFGIYTDNLIVDIVLYTAIGLSFILIILIIHRNSILKKRKK